MTNLDTSQSENQSERYPARIRAAELSPDGHHAILTYEITLAAGQVKLLELMVPAGEVGWPTLLLTSLRGGRKPKNIQ